MSNKAYPKTLKRKDSEDWIVFNSDQEAQARKEGFTLDSDPPKDPPEGPGGDAKVEFSEHRTDPIDPRTGSRTVHPEAPAPDVREQPKEKE